VTRLEAAILFRIVALGLPCPSQEYVFASPRRWRLDFAWVDQLIAIEAEGGTWVQGRHTRGAGFRSDCDKYNHAVLQGWRIFRITTDMLEDGAATALLEKLREIL